MAFGEGLTRGAQVLTHNRDFAASRGAIAGSGSAVQGTGCAGRAKRRQDVGSGLPHSGNGEDAPGSLGRTTDVSLEQARERANGLTSAARSGRDLIGEEEDARGAAASRITVEKLIELYLRRRVVGRLRTAKSIESRLRRTLAPVLHRYAADICRRDMRELLDLIADGGQGRESEKRRQVCRAMFRWALSQDIVEADPTAGLTPYDRGAPRCDKVARWFTPNLIWNRPRATFVR